MNIFIFEDISKVSGVYHSEGGLVIIANDINHAKEVIMDDHWIRITDKEWEAVESFDLKDNVEPKYWVMPNAGCC